MPVLSYLHQLFNAEHCHASIHTLRWKDRPHSTRFLRNNCLRVGTPLKLRHDIRYASAKLS